MPKMEGDEDLDYWYSMYWKEFSSRKTSFRLPKCCGCCRYGYNREIPPEGDKVVIVQSVHGLEGNPQIFDKILYLLPPRRHLILWLRRAWAWFATGIVDLSAPKAKRKRFAVSNIPIILRILMGNILMSRTWIRADLCQIQDELESKTHITSWGNEGYRIIKSWIVNYANSAYCMKHRR